jgi:polyphosphate kinase 2 (PPK2 family)
MILRTTSDAARWHVIAANDKRHARVATLKAVNDGLTRVLRQG